MKKISLPGYFNNHFFIRAILELYKDYREYFYDDIVLDSAYDLPDGIIWNGGREMSAHIYEPELNKIIDQVMQFYTDINFPLWHVCTNSMLEEKHLHDLDCNNFFDKWLKPNDKVVINSPLLKEYMKEKWDPEFVYSTTIGIRSIDEINKLTETNILCISYKDQQNMDYMRQLKHPENIEIMGGEACHLDCCDRFHHQECMNLYILGVHTPEIDQGIYCTRPLLSNDTVGIDYYMQHDGFLPLDVFNQLGEMGIGYFKIVGRERQNQDWLDTVAYYIIKPEHKDKFCRKMMLRKPGFNYFTFENPYKI